MQRRKKGANERSLLKVGYSEGSIVRIKLKDFMTYKFLELRPGPSLNVVVGTNGSGKSSLVCAICLGLCGTPQTVGRASHIGGYIRHGADTAFIEIELYSPTVSNYLIERVITSSKSTWKLNNVQVSQKAVEAAVAGLNIQVSNLCQFLPQDRVADFVRMSRQELLLSTEKAVGTRDIHLLHARLIELQHREVELQNMVKGQRERLIQERHQNAQLDEEVRKLGEYRNIRNRIEILRKKLAWLDYDGTRQTYMAEKVLLEQKVSALKAKQKERVPLKQQIEKEVFHEHNQRCKDQLLKPEAAAALQKVQGSYKKLLGLSEKGGAVKAGLQSKIEQQASLQKKITELKADIEALEKELSMDQTDVVELKLERAKAEIEKCNQTTKEIFGSKTTAEDYIQNKRKESAAVQGEIERLKDRLSLRMEMLRRSSEDAFTATQWLLKNEGLFEGKVHPPIMTQIEVPNQEDLRYVEAQIPFREMVTFVVEKPADLVKLLSLLRDDKGLRINCALMPETPVDSFRPKLPLAQIRSLGFRDYVQSLLRAPDGVMRYLCEYCRIHDAPVGNEHTEDCLDEITALGIRHFYTHKRVYSVKTSLYDSSRISTMIREIRKPNLLTVSVDETGLVRLAQLKKVLEGEIASKSDEVKELAIQEKEVSSKLEEWRTNKRNAMMELSRHRQVKVLLDRRLKELKSLQQNILDLDEERAKTTSQLHALGLAKVAAVAELVKKQKACFEKHQQWVQHRMEMFVTAMSKKKLENALQAAIEAAEPFEREVREILEHLEVLKQRTRSKLAQAQAAIGCSSQISQIPPDIAKEFLKLPKSAVEIAEVIHTHEAKLSCMLPVDAAVESDYRRRQQDIAQLEGDVSLREAQLAEVTEEMVDINDRWLPDLECLLERIDQGFQRFFRALGCVGQVALYKGSRHHEYDQYGVNIRVKFRDHEPLTELSPDHQSGGERSVATVLYMMALQELTRVPFRCVDEINQGMDSENERKIFEMVMNTALQNSAQYFLLTPKLLQNLPYAENVTMIFLSKSADYIEGWSPKSLVSRSVGLAAMNKSRAGSSVGSTARKRKQSC